LDAQDLQKGGGGGNVLWRGGGAFFAKPLRGRPGRGFRNVALDATVRKTPVTPPTMHDLHAASLRQLQGRHVPTTSTSSHGPLTAQLTRAIVGPSSFWGLPALRSLERARSRAGLSGATVSVLDTGVSRSTCSWASSMAQLRPRGNNDRSYWRRPS
jgi:hypothetical protein